MIKSMTGYGSAKGNVLGFDVSIELKSVNNKYLETSVRLPRNYLFAEEKIKACVAKHISRGKVDVFVSINAVEADDVVIKVNESLAKQYIKALSNISDSFGLTNNVSALDISRFPDVLCVERNEVDADAISEGIVCVLETALNDFDKMRLTEGSKLRTDVLSRISTIEEYVSVVEKTSPDTVKAYTERLEQKMKEVLDNSTYDESRIIAEAALFADHIAVDEETVRLRSHIAQMNSFLNSESPIGRKMDFLIQEFNRESNTIGSKCQNSEIAHVVVDLKSEIEKIREQIQNIE